MKPTAARRRAASCARSGSGRRRCWTPISAWATPTAPSLFPPRCSCAPTARLPRATSASSTKRCSLPCSRLWETRSPMAGITWFRRLAVVTAIFAYLQIALGGVVRVTGSGLGCPDWPLCHGRPYPPANLGSIIEYSHRAVRSVTELLILATFFRAWVVWRRRRPVAAWLASASLVARLGGALLGAGVVANELASCPALLPLPPPTL